MATIGIEVRPVEEFASCCGVNLGVTEAGVVGSDLGVQGARVGMSHRGRLGREESAGVVRTKHG